MRADDSYSSYSSIGHLLVRCRWIIYTALACLNDRPRSMYYYYYYYYRITDGDVRELALLWTMVDSVRQAQWWSNSRSVALR
jgi:hypothetical protein